MKIDFWFFVNFGGKKLFVLWFKYQIVDTLLISVIKVTQMFVFFRNMFNKAKQAILRAKLLYAD